MIRRQEVHFTRCAYACALFAWLPMVPASGQSFQAPQSFAVSADAPEALVLCHLNADAFLDVVTANVDSDDISVLLGDGLGGFGPASTHSVGNAPVALAAGDLNGDDLIDVAIANHSGNSVSLLFGDGAGGFGATSSLGSAELGGTVPSHVLLADLDGDTQLDLVTALSHNLPADLSVAFGDGLGGFSAASLLEVGGVPRTVVAVNLDQNATPDLVAANSFSDNLSVLLGSGDGSFGAATTLSVGNEPRSMVVVDLGGDEHLDLAVANRDSGNLSILQGNGLGGFGTVSNHPTGISPNSVATGDLNGDGNADLATVNTGFGQVSLLLGNGLGGLAPAATFNVGSFPRALAIADVNSDSKPDLVAADPSQDSVIVFLNTTSFPPRFLDPSPCGETLNASVGVPIDFELAVADPDGADLLALDVQGLPSGAQMSPALPIIGNFSSSTFQWTPTNADVGTHVLTFTAAGGGFAASPCTLTIEVAECFLLLARSVGSEPFTAGGHTWSTDLDGVRISYPVTMADGPALAIPSRGRSFEPGRLAPPGSRAGSGLLQQLMRSLRPVMLTEFSAQVLMWNPEVFPNRPEQSSNGLRVALWSDGSLQLTSVAQSDGMQLSAEIFVAEDGREYLRFPFSIDGF